jgi:hypothetical protein
MGEDVIVVETFDEARQMGARTLGGILRDPNTCERFVSLSAGPHGMRIGNAIWTHRARGHRNAERAERLHETILRSQAKTPKGER